MIRSRLTLRARLYLLVIMGLVPIFLVVILQGGYYYRYAVEYAQFKLHSIVLRASSEQQAKISKTEELLTVLSNIQDIKDRKAGYCDMIAGMLERHVDYVNLGFIDPDGQQVCSGLPVRKPLDFSQDRWFIDAMKQKKFFVSDYRIGRISGKPVALSALPVMDNAGQLLGALYATTGLNLATNLDMLPEQSVFVLFDRDGMILQRNPNPRDWVGKRMPEQRLIREVISNESSGVVETEGLDGVRRVFAFNALVSEKEKVYLAIGMPTEQVYARARKDMLFVVISFVLAMVSMLSILWVAGNRLVVDRVRRLTGAAKQYVQGNYDVRCGVGGRMDEIGLLAHTMNEMATVVQLRERELVQYQCALDAHAIVSVTDVAGTIIYVNDKFCEISGYARGELIGQNHRLLSSGCHPSQFFNEMWETISQGKIWHGDIQNRRKDRDSYWVASTIVPFLDENGLPLKYFSVRTDVTHVMLVNEALRDSEQRFRLLAENSLDVISIHTQDRHIAYISPSCERVLGYTQDELVGRIGIDFIHPDDTEMVYGNLHEPALKGETGVCNYVRMRHKNDCYIHVDVTAAPFYNEAGRIVGIQSSFRDSSARKQVEDVLRLHNRAVAASASGIVIFQRDTLAIEYANAAFARLVELPETDLPGQCWPILAEASGSVREWQSLHDAVAAGDECHMLVEALSQQGIPIWCHVFLSPVCSERGEVAYCVAALSDMTERVEMEQALKHAKEFAESASRAKSEFLANVSHELRTPLNAIVGFAQLMEADPVTPLSEGQRETVQRIMRAGWVLRKMVNDVLDLSRIDVARLELKMENVDVTGLVRESMEMVIVPAAEKGLEIVDLSSKCGRQIVYADALRLKQILINLLSNAVKYNRDGGRVIISCPCPSDGGIRIAVTDTGIGIPLEKRGELFMHFSRLGADKSGIPGAGVGLALSRRLVELMGGTIGVESLPREGSTFWVELPAAQGEAGTSDHAASLKSSL